MRALRTFTDESDETRKNGEEWLITSKDTEAHIPNVYEEVMKYDNYPHTHTHFERVVTSIYALVGYNQLALC